MEAIIYRDLKKKKSTIHIFEHPETKNLGTEENETVVWKITKDTMTC